MRQTSTGAVPQICCRGAPARRSAGSAFGLTGAASAWRHSAGSCALRVCEGRCPWFRLGRKSLGGQITSAKHTRGVLCPQLNEWLSMLTVLGFQGLGAAAGTRHSRSKYLMFRAFRSLPCLGWAKYLCPFAQKGFLHVPGMDAAQQKHELA